MAEKLTACDPAEGLASGETIAAFMEEAFRTDDAPYIAHTLGVMARAKAVTQIANDTCPSREQLYPAFSETRTPALKNTIPAINALGMALTTTSVDGPKLWAVA